MERLGQLIDSRDAEPDAPVVAIEAPGRPEKPVDVIDHAATGNESTGKDAESREDHVTPVTAAAFAAVPADAEAVEPAEELARLPDDPGVDPDDEAEKS
ncbi:heme biosynthesis protein HemY, partial [Mesorhizobium sp. M2D.F.Ca.ET.160.01.1.1]